MARTKTSKRWLQEHFSDQYVKKAQADGYRGRAAYKLLEIQKKDRLIQPNMTVIDLGAAPGSWSQVAIQQIGKKGKLIALDVLPMDRIAGVDFIQGDFTDDEVYNQLLSLLTNQTVNVILSDIAPNSSGNRNIDQPRIMGIAELVLEFATKVLCKNGSLLIKLFQGEGFTEYQQALRQHFEKVVVRKPDASRARSRETFLLARGFR